MNFFITDAFAESAIDTTQSGLEGLLFPLLIIFLSIYLIFFRPKAQKEKINRK